MSNFEQQESAAAVAEPPAEAEVRRVPDKKRTRPKRQPRYHVILWDDPDHTFEYVIQMMQELFAHSYEKGFLIAREVDGAGRVICLTTTLEHAELKRDQIHAYGRDELVARSKGSMSASIEPEPG